MNKLYQHPDGAGEISLDADNCRLFVGNESELLSAFVLIGPAGVRALGLALIAAAAEMEVRK